MHTLAPLLLGLFHTHELATLLLAILIEEAGIPIPLPGDTLVVLAGAQTPHAIGHTLAVVGVSSLAVFLGSSVLFTLVQREGRPLLTKYGKYVLLHERRLAQMESWFARRGRNTVIVGRLIPGLRIPTTIMAGLSGMACSEFALMGMEVRPRVCREILVPLVHNLSAIVFPAVDALALSISCFCRCRTI